jgi:outer membrane lipoprotein-sorting protein
MKILLALLLFSTPVFAQAPKPMVLKPEPALAAPKKTNGAPKETNIETSYKDLVAMVNGYWNSVRFGTADFVQLDPGGKRTEGQFYFTKPGLLRFEYAPPSPVEVVADGKGVAVRDKRLNTQDIYPIGQTPLQFLLSEKIDLGADKNVKSITRDADNIYLTLEEKKALGGTHSLEITFDAKTLVLKQWNVTDPQGFETSIAIHNLKANMKPNPDKYKIDYTKYN